MSEIKLPLKLQLLLSLDKILKISLGYFLKEIYTVGHSIYETNGFVELLKNNNVNTIVDVRSMPYSKFASQYNKELLHQYLKTAHQHQHSSHLQLHFQSRVGY